MNKYLFVLLFSLSSTLLAEVERSELYHIDIQTLADGLNHPWGMALLPNQDILITERIGKLRLISNGQLHDDPIKGLPTIKQHGQGGLLDVVLHPNYISNQLIYLSYAGEDSGKLGTEVLQAKLVAHHLEQVTKVFVALPKSTGGQHFGGRLLFVGEDLYVTLGDRGARKRAQNLNDHAGSLVRIKDTGSVPDGNPFVDQEHSKAEIYSYGHRNIQGIALHPNQSSVWIHEHGPQGGDEINIIQPGLNYGWPVITYGVNYVIGTKIGEGTHKEGMEQPIYYWVPSIAPSGMAFYAGKEFPQWQNNLLVGSLKFGLLVRLVIKDKNIIHEERLLDGKYGRIRDVETDPDGIVYLLTDEKDGSLLRLRNNMTN